MNFLGHAVIAHSGSDEYLLGNLIADGIKGRNLSAWPADIALGIRRHRQLDEWIDHHAEVQALKAYVPREVRRVSGIGFDLVWDHFLSVRLLDPETQHPALERGLIDRIYEVLSLNAHLIPGRMGPLCDALIRQRWLERYADYGYTCQSVRALGHRIPRQTPQMYALGDWLETHPMRLEAAFERLWPDLESQTRRVG
ncbi:ACP phosphodiesterase [Larsenimonas salina]|uniref:ACP phosphodiesterase n=1 Tax=Larsenimonas salina TaxID=1295565 RepID=UPI00207383DD|nr:ACP phosphodiesterase [Larsenimonas salina]